MDSRVLRNIDLNLLVVFEALMRERHVSRAAKKLAIGQPGLSGALARLRRLFDDPLLVRVGRDLQPTPRALELIGPVEQALQLIEGSTARRARFAPREANRTFTLGMTDDHELLFAPAVALALHQQAPAARLVIRPVDRHGLRGALDDGALDLALCALDGRMLVAWHGRQVLFQEGYACIWSPKRLRVAPRLTLKRFLEVPHVLVTFNGDLSGRIDDGLGALGKRRNVVVGVPRFAALPAILSTMAAISTVPTHIARFFACQRGMQMTAPPVAVPPQDYGLVYRQRDAALADLVWFRRLVADSVAGVLGGMAPAPPHRRAR